MNALQRIEQAVNNGQPEAVKDMQAVRTALTNLIRLSRFGYQQMPSREACEFAHDMYDGALDALGMDRDTENRLDGGGEINLESCSK